MQEYLNTGCGYDKLQTRYFYLWLLCVHLSTTLTWPIKPAGNSGLSFKRNGALVKVVLFSLVWMQIEIKKITCKIQFQFLLCQ